MAIDWKNVKSADVYTNAYKSLKGYFVTLNVENGKVDQKTYTDTNPGDDIEWTIIPNDTYTLPKTVEGGGQISGNKVSFTVPENNDTDIVLSATCPRNEVELVLTNCSLTETEPAQENSQAVTYNTTATWTIEANDGYVLPESVEGATIENGVITTDPITEPTTITVDSLIKTTLSVVNGKLVETEPAQENPKVVAYNETASWTIQANEHYHLPTELEGATISAEGAITTYAITEPTTITAYCPIDTFEVSLELTNAELAETESAQELVQTIEYSNTATWTIKADEHYHLPTELEGATITEDGVITTDPITEDTTITVECPIDTFEVSLELTNCTTDTLTKTVDYNQTATWTITPNDGYILPETIEGGTITEEGILTTNPVTEDTTITVECQEAAVETTTTTSSSTTSTTTVVSQYNFISYSSAEGSEQYGTGTVRIVGANEEYTEIEIVYNSVDNEDFAPGKHFFVLTNVEEGQRRQLYVEGDDTLTPIDVWVTVTPAQ